MNEHKTEENNSAYESLKADYCNQIFYNRENHIVHNPYNQEMRVLEAIERGDPDTAREAIWEDFSAFVGILSEDPLRHEKNIGIVNVTTSSRAAIRGGLHYEKAYTLSDCCIRQIEKCDDINEIRALYKAAQLQYAEMVRDSKSAAADAQGGNNPHIEHCKDYIFSHLHGKITVQEIANYVGLTQNYLSALFQKCEHISLKQYILNEKIKLVQRMLIYSPYSYIEISNYLGFTSQSHMGREFKKATGMTPRKYREKYQKDDFFERE
ncbi:MAG: helix-turn-helix domain-containing protein [Eubacteriales bacterium]|nr:helix-turn-helix domain-containing protein [Eubacteriales bacterium]